MSAVRLKNSYSVNDIRGWIISGGWQPESTFTIICYLKGKRPMSKFSEEQLEEIARHVNDPENIDHSIVPKKDMVCNSTAGRPVIVLKIFLLG